MSGIKVKIKTKNTAFFDDCNSETEIIRCLKDITECLKDTIDRLEHYDGHIYDIKGGKIGTYKIIK